MGKNSKTFGVLTPGGNAPGLSRFVEGVVLQAGREGVNLIGLKYGLESLVEIDESNIVDFRSCARDELFKALRSPEGSYLGGSRNRVDEAELPAVAETIEYYQKKFGISALIAAGGDGSAAALNNIAQAGIIQTNLAPATIDNDIYGTDTAIGFQSAAEFASMLLRQQRGDAQAHKRIVVVQIMGRDSGALALQAGSAADITLIDECPVPEDQLLQRVEELYIQNKHVVICVAEGYRPRGLVIVDEGVKDGAGNARKGDVAGYVENFLQKNLSNAARKVNKYENQIVRSVTLGSTVRAAPPNHPDIILAQKMGAAALHLAVNDRLGYMVGKQDGQYKPVPLSEVKGSKRVSPDRYDMANLKAHLIPVAIRNLIEETEKKDVA